VGPIRNDVGGHAAVRFSESEAVRLAREAYGIEATAAALPGEYDDNFLLTAASGAFVLKVMHPQREHAFVDLQFRALEHLALHASELGLPRVVSTSAGESIAAATDAGGAPRLVWLLRHLPGRLLAEAQPHPAELLRDLGRFLGRLDAALADFTHPAARRDLKWDFTRAGWVREHLALIREPGRRASVERILEAFDAEVAPALPGLRRSVVHGDANDHNVVVTVGRGRAPALAGLIDFGDMLHTVTVAEVAIAATYALFGAADPLAAAAQVVAGYHGAYPLTEPEIALLFPLIRTRLAVSVVNSACRAAAEPGDPYLAVSEASAWEAIWRLAAVHPRFAHFTFRAACGLPAVPQSAAVVEWLRALPGGAAPVLDGDLRTTPCLVFDLSVGSRMLGADPAALETAALTETLWREMRTAGVAVGVGRYDEARPIYTTAAFASGERPTEEHRTVHLGIDLFVPPGSAVRAPLAGTVHVLANNAAAKDYGPLVILRHATGDGAAFFTLYGHLGPSCLERLVVGQQVARGQRIAEVGAPPGNGDWAPHLHLQLITDLLELDRDLPGVAFASRRDVWCSLSPDPNVLLGIPAERFPAPEPSAAAILATRRAQVGRNLSVSYRRPLRIVRGWRQYLYDDTGRAYLDAYNNVPLVGHGHPRVVRAVQEQLALLNTNTRYLHENLTRYVERLTALMPAPLRVAFVLNSASEANELALRLARTHTGREDVVVLEHAYHGHTTTLIDISPYKFAGRGGGGRKLWVHVAPIPDDYRGAYRRGDPAAGRKYAGHVGEIVARVGAEGRGVGAFIAETLPSVGGQVVFPPGYLAEAYRHVRAAGGLCIADEVQVGFGRLGTHFWGFETQGVVPDIVVLGKPIGNGFPLAAVVTTPEIAASFDNGMEFFSTFGGNPVACAAGLAVLDVMRDERLQANALRVGSRLLGGLCGLAARHQIIGDVRGSGLFLGVELVRDRGTLEPAGEEAAYLVDRLREEGVLAGTDGPHHNVIKLRPPLVVSDADADLLVAVLDEVLGEDAARA
jgi:4-aminobutyrate aminotransferase-like enzyme/Ser/Thr protein kinase RdoA (MazF antagonist)